MKRRSKTEEALAAAAESHADDPQRAELLERARRFKASWVELAEALVEARRSQAWERWGYASFEAYAKTELHLRQDTVDKLTRSFTFLKSHAPEVLRRDGVQARIPSLKAVEFLRRAEEESDAPVDVVTSLRQRVLEDNVRPERLAREYGPAVFPRDAEAKAAQDLAGIRNVASRLRTLLTEADGLPKKLTREVVAQLDELLAHVTPKDADAA